jgi:hypothetical protein
MTRQVKRVRLVVRDDRISDVTLHVSAVIPQTTSWRYPSDSVIRYPSDSVIRYSSKGVFRYPSVANTLESILRLKSMREDGRLPKTVVKLLNIILNQSRLPLILIPSTCQ